MTPAPTRTLERRLYAAGHRLVAGMDEVGRGSLAGPVSVGVVILDSECGRMPSGVRDSKLLTPAAREALVGPIRAWAKAWGVGHATPAEIDRYGITGGLRLAGHRALAAAGSLPVIVVLDGVHDWLNARAPSAVPCPTPQVITQIKGDLTVAAIAAASVLAKTERDAIMRSHHEQYPQYGWKSNKGYAARAHTEALRAHGACEHHRRSWNLPLGPASEQPTLL